MVGEVDQKGEALDQLVNSLGNLVNKIFSFIFQIIVSLPCTVVVLIYAAYLHLKLLTRREQLIVLLQQTFFLLLVLVTLDLFDPFLAFDVLYQRLLMPFEIGVSVLYVVVFVLHFRKAVEVKLSNEGAELVGAKVLTDDWREALLAFYDKTISLLIPAYQLVGFHRLIRLHLPDRRETRERSFAYWPVPAHSFS